MRIEVDKGSDVPVLQGPDQLRSGGYGVGCFVPQDAWIGGERLPAGISCGFRDDSQNHADREPEGIREGPGVSSGLEEVLIF